jgi:hypothetical protein
MTEGQIILPAGVRCTVGAATIKTSDVARTAALTGDRVAAASALLERTVLRAAAPVDPQTVLAAERALIRAQFHGSRTRYLAALGTSHLTLSDARAIIADRIGRERVEERFRPSPPTTREIADFETTYATTQVRLVSVDTEAPWLGDAFRGFAVQTIAPDEVFVLPLGRRKAIDTIDGRFTVRPLGPSLPLYALPPAKQAVVAQHVLGRFARDDVYARWLGAEETKLLATAVCLRDDLPAPGDVDLTAWAPYLGA